MTDAKHIPQARFWNVRQIAARLGRRDSWFYNNRRQLEQLGFPKRDNALRLWDSVAVEAWLDRRAGVESSSGIESRMLEAIHGQDHVAVS